MSSAAPVKSRPAPSDRGGSRHSGGRRKNRRRSKHHHVYTDGSHRKDIGALAVVWRDVELGKAIRCETSMQAEWEALLYGLELAHNWGLKRVTFRTDCKSLVRLVDAVMHGDKRDRGLAQDAARYLKANPGWDLEWVPRERNRKADALATRVRRNAGKRRIHVAA